VEKLLDQLDAKFDEMSSQILDRSMSWDFLSIFPSTDFDTYVPVSQMSNRVDSLEASIQDIINGDSNQPQ